MIDCILLLLTGRQKAAKTIRFGLRSESGNSTLELSLVLALFGMPLLLGTYEAALLIHDSIEISDAAHAAATYGAMSFTYAADTSQMQTIAQDDAPDFGSNLAVTPTTFYACSQSIGGTQYSTQAAANSACPSGQANHYLEFVQVNTSATMSLPVHIAGLPSSLTVTGSSVMEVTE